MQKRVLQKIIDELNKENPKLDYIRGILETLIDGLPESTNSNLVEKQEKGIVSTPISSTLELDEGAILDAQAKAALEKIKGMQLNNE